MKNITLGSLPDSRYRSERIMEFGKGRIGIQNIAGSSKKEERGEALGLPGYQSPHEFPHEFTVAVMVPL